jgi:transposase InsO family protein
VIIDIFSTYVVGWLIADRESAALAKKLLANTIAKHGIDRDQVTLHADKRLLYGRQTGGVPARRPRHDQDPLPAAHLQRQPLP